MYFRFKHIVKFVSILVVLDVVLEACNRSECLSRLQVSILVVLDVVLEDGMDFG